MDNGDKIFSTILWLYCAVAIYMEIMMCQAVVTDEYATRQIAIVKTIKNVNCQKNKCEYYVGEPDCVEMNNCLKFQDDGCKYQDGDKVNVYTHELFHFLDKNIEKCKNMGHPYINILVLIAWLVTILVT
jgi:hypothetical protein